MADKRNQPCPCGSGKRYKKCCGRTNKVPGSSQVSTKQAITADGKSAETCFQMGLTAADQNKFEDAAEYYRQAIKLRPDFPEALNNLGVISKFLGNLDEAEYCFNRLIELNPESPAAHCNYGVILKEKGLLKAAESSFKKAISFNPNFAEAHYNLGIILEDLGFPQEAESSLRMAVRHKTGYVNALNRLANLAKGRGRLEEAYELYQQALAANPENVMTLFNLARIRTEQGLLDEAEEKYRQAINAKPDYGEAHRCLASIIKYKSEADEHLRMMEQLHSRNDLQNSERMHLAFALGKAFEDLAEYGKAFAYYTEGNRLKRATFRYATADNSALFERIKQVFSRISPSPQKMDDINNPTPIFILGMPRSGTSLIEQILASHSEVYGAGELIDMEESILQVTGTNNIHDALTTLNGEDQAQMCAQIGKEYLKRLSRHAPTAHLITDKMPANFLYIGVMRLALPRARIIHCSRDPMDNCLSIYKNYFAGDLNYAYDLIELGEYYRLYVNVMNFWNGLYPGAIYDLHYERLIADQEVETRRLLEYCGLPWQQNCLNFHRTERRVETASAIQVRRPIYQDSVRLWRQYARQLAPLRETLGDLVH